MYNDTDQSIQILEHVKHGLQNVLKYLSLNLYVSHKQTFETVISKHPAECADTLNKKPPQNKLIVTFAANKTNSFKTSCSITDFSFFVTETVLPRPVLITVSATNLCTYQSNSMVILFVYILSKT